MGSVNGTSRTLVDWCLSSLTGPTGNRQSSEVDLSMLTVVVPSLDRQDYLLRQIRFWASSSADLIVIDGSTQPLDYRVRSAMEHHERMTYLHAQSSLSERLAMAAERIETPYTVLGADDEFHLQTGLSASLDILGENPELVGCIGQCLWFGIVGRAHHLICGPSYPQHLGYSVRNPNPADRLMTAMSGYTPATCYGVLRTPTWQSTWGSLPDWSAPTAMEHQHAMAVYLLGGFVATDHIQWLRSSENEMIVKPLWNSKTSFTEWWTRSDAIVQVEYCESVATLVSQQLQVEVSEISTWVLEAIESYLIIQPQLDVSHNKPAYKVTRPWRVHKAPRMLSNLLPDSLLLRVKSAKGRALRALGQQGGDYYGTLDEMPAILQSEGLVLTSAAAAELATIEATIQEFNTLRADPALRVT